MKCSSRQQPKQNPCSLKTIVPKINYICCCKTVQQHEAVFCRITPGTAVLQTGCTLVHPPF